MVTVSPTVRLRATPSIGVVDLAGILLVASGCALLIVKPSWGFAAIVLSTAPVLLLCLFHAVLKGSIEPVILGWAAIFPLGYYFLSFPLEKSVITLDRALPLALLPAMLLTPRGKSARVPEDLRRCAMFWTAFLVVAGISVIRGGDPLTNGRLFVDGFCLPALLGWCIIRNWQVRESTVMLHLFASLMAVYAACIGTAEMILKRDVLPLPGSGLDFAGSLPRPNGPFYSNDSFALIGLVTFFFLLFLRRTWGEDVPSWRRIIHGLGLSGALIMALLPMFRSVIITLMLVLLIEIATTRRPGSRAAKIALLLLFITSVSVIKILAPDAYEDRSKPENFYGRIAEQMQTVHVFLSHPLFGVGLGQFLDFASGDTRYLTLYEGVQSLDSPHNDLGAILAETGIVGFLPYVAAQITLISAFWRLRRRHMPDSQLVWKFFLYVFLSYWVSGMTLASGYHSDLNLWFILALSVMYKYAMTERSVPRQAETRLLAAAAGLNHRHRAFGRQSLQSALDV